MYIISRCLLGDNCKYDGGNNLCEALVEFCKTHDYVAVCPEVAGGLPVPRKQDEIVVDDDGSWKLSSEDGEDFSEAFDYGARLSVASVLVEAGNRQEHRGIIEGAILRANSPSCGAGAIYDGSFTGTLTGGNGVFVDKLIDACLEERNNPYIADENRLFSNSFEICTQDNFAKVFGDK